MVSSLLSLLIAIIIGIAQIIFSKNQKKRIKNVETKINQIVSNNQILGIVGNSNVGDISNNKF
jgi:preprotein translocase subunit YajC